MTTIIAENENELIKTLAGLIQEISNDAIRESGVFKVGVSGGSLVKFLSKGLEGVKSDFSKWRVFFCDERVVPFDDGESTFGVYKKELVGKILEEGQFIKIKQGVSAQEAATDYVQQMAQYFPANQLPRFDLLLLGMGPDGHTCSLFPGHRLLNVNDVWVAAIVDSPKPPPERITLTFPVVNNAKNCIFAMAGEGKADMVKVGFEMCVKLAMESSIVARILVDKEDLPAGRVRPESGRLYWILDKGAAKHLN